MNFCQDFNKKIVSIGVVLLFFIIVFLPSFISAACLPASGCVDTWVCCPGGTPALFCNDSPYSITTAGYGTLVGQKGIELFTDCTDCVCSAESCSPYVQNESRWGVCSDGTTITLNDYFTQSCLSGECGGSACKCGRFTLGISGGGGCVSEYGACPGGTSDCCSGLVCWSGSCVNSLTCDTATCQGVYPGSTYSSCTSCNGGDTLYGTFGSLGCASQLCSCCSPTAPTNYTLTVQKNGTGSGTVTSNPAGIDCGADCTQSYSVNTSVTLTPVASGGSAFSGWSGGGCSGSGNCTVAMTNNITVTATFNVASLPSLIGIIKVKHPLGILSLRLITFADARNVLRGIMKVMRYATDIFTAADLVETTDPNASPVRVKTPYGIKAWRKQ